MPHCAHQCTPLLVCVVCSCSLFADLSTLLAYLLICPFLSLRSSDVFLTSSAAPTLSLLLPTNTQDLFAIITFILKKSVLHMSAVWTQKSRTHHSCAKVPDDLQLMFTFQRSMDIAAIDTHHNMITQRPNL